MLAILEHLEHEVTTLVFTLQYQSIYCHSGIASRCKPDHLCLICSYRPHYEPFNAILTLKATHNESNMHRVYLVFIFYSQKMQFTSSINLQLNV